MQGFCCDWKYNAQTALFVPRDLTEQTSPTTCSFNRKPKYIETNCISTQQTVFFHSHERKNHEENQLCGGIFDARHLCTRADYDRAYSRPGGPGFYASFRDKRFNCENTVEAFRLCRKVECYPCLLPRRLERWMHERSMHHAG